MCPETFTCVDFPLNFSSLSFFFVFALCHSLSTDTRCTHEIQSNLHSLSYRPSHHMNILMSICFCLTFVTKYSQVHIYICLLALFVCNSTARRWTEWMVELNFLCFSNTAHVYVNARARVRERKGGKREGSNSKPTSSWCEPTMITDENNSAWCGAKKKRKAAREKRKSSSTQHTRYIHTDRQDWRERHEIEIVLFQPPPPSPPPSHVSSTDWIEIADETEI